VAFIIIEVRCGILHGAAVKLGLGLARSLIVISGLVDFNHLNTQPAIGSERW